MPSLAKLTRPKVHRALPRERLFKELDASRERPLVWLVAPPGSGKTTLVSTYVDARKMRAAWYHIDAGDDDVGTFFYYLAQTVPSTRAKRSQSLPLLSPAHRADLCAFSRLFFRSYFARLMTPGLLVLDNYHELPAHSSLHAVLQEAIDEVPQDLNIVTISRAAPPREFLPFKAAERLATLEWSSLRLSLEETRAIAAQRTPVDEPTLRRIHRLSDGWAAGVALTLERARLPDRQAGEEPQEERADLFDYFATQVLRSAAPEMQEFLKRTALLPRMTAEMAERLTGRHDSEAVLEDLHRRGVFTDRRSTKPPIYEYHDLFREFLSTQLEQ